MGDVTVSFFSAAIRTLVEQHGDKDCPFDRLEELRRHLAEAERIYRDLPSRSGAPQGEAPK